jgi:membrane-bound lytic murein transglycosylase B
MFTRRALLSTFALTPLAANAQDAFDAAKSDIWRNASSKGVTRSTFDAAFKGVSYNESIVALSQKQPEFKESLGDYVSRRVSTKRVTNGIAAFKEHRGLLKQAESQYGVPAELICSFWGMETNYGTFTGQHNVIEALASLIAANRRRDFFMSEITHALLILQDGDITAATMKGSWAGAMGQTQFMPSSFRTYAVDMDGDGKRNIWTNLADAFGSTANYVKKTGWIKGQKWGAEIINGVKPFEGRVWQPMQVGPTFVLTQNFAVIKRYNNADSYALAVGHLADRIIGGKPFVAAWGAGNDGLTHGEREEIQTHLKRLGYDIGDVDGFFGDKTKAALHEMQAKLGFPQVDAGSKELLNALKKAR